MNDGVVLVRDGARFTASPGAKVDAAASCPPPTTRASIPRHSPRGPTPARPTASTTEASVAWFSPRQPENGEVGATALVRVHLPPSATSTGRAAGIHDPSLPYPTRPTAPWGGASAVWLQLQWPESFSNVASTASTVAKLPLSPRGEGRHASGRGRKSPLPSAPAAARRGSIGAEVQLRGWAPAPRARRPLAAAPTGDNEIADVALSLARNDGSAAFLHGPASPDASHDAADRSASADSAVPQAAMLPNEPVTAAEHAHATS